MFYALSWFVVVALFALWSLAAWSMHAVAAWTVSSAGALSGSASGVGAIAVPEWLAPWVPVELVKATLQYVSGLGPAVDAVLQAAPVLATGLTAATWVIWGIGSALLLVVGVGLHVMIALWRGRVGRSSSREARRPMAAG